MGVLIWIALFMSALVAAGLSLFWGPREPATLERRQMAWFCVVSLIVGIAVYAGFLKLLNYYTQPWYYLALVTFAGVCIEPLLQPKEGSLLRPFRALIMALFLAATLVSSTRVISARHTNVDLVAQNLASLAGPEDLILLTRWECGVTMNRYYKGPADWSTIPPLKEFRFQAYQPVMEQMRAEAPLHPIFSRAAKVLQSGHRVWLVGETPTPLPGQPPPFLPRVGDGRDGWHGSCSFYNVWIMQVTHFLREHFTSAKRLTLSNVGSVSEFENLSVSFVEGWK